MKRLVIFFLIIIAIVSTVYYLYMNRISEYKVAQKENVEFEIFKNQEIEGSQLTTLINKAIDLNSKNKVEKDTKGKYVDNESNSINIDVKFIDDDITYNIEKIYNGGMDKFLAYYGNIEFKCIEVQYHQKTNKIKYMLFEQITD